MNPVGKALWYIESHFAGEITLDDIAEAGGASRFNLSRAFGTATGHSVMHFVSGRRLSEAAKARAADAPDFERYGENFNPETGMGGIEIWIPLKA